MIIMSQLIIWYLRYVNSGIVDLFMQSEVNKEFPGGLVVRILGFHCHGQGSVPGGKQRSEIGNLRPCKSTEKKKKEMVR